MQPASDITNLLQRAQQGEQRANQELYSLIYEELRRVGHRYMRNEREAHTLQTTALVNEAFLRLVPIKAIEWGGREQFFKAAAGTMRSILVDHARKKLADKRALPGRRVALDHVLDAYAAQSVDVIAVDEALAKLEKRDERLARVVELRFFAGLTIPETAEVLGVSTNTVDRCWQMARAWIMGELERPS